MIFSRSNIKTALLWVGIWGAALTVAFLIPLDIHAQSVNDAARHGFWNSMAWLLSAAVVVGIALALIALSHRRPPAKDALETFHHEDYDEASEYPPVRPQDVGPLPEHLREE